MKREHALKLRAAIVKASASLDDSTALTAVELFDAWKIDHDYKQGDRFHDGGKLYKVLQDHHSQENWKPAETPSLYAQVPEPGQGETPDNPIYYNNNMKLEKGKYYAQNNVVYVCTLGTGIPVYSDLSALVGLYVEVYSP